MVDLKGYALKTLIFVGLPAVTMAIIFSTHEEPPSWEHCGSGWGEGYPYDTATAPPQKSFDYDDNGKLDEDEYRRWKQACRNWEAGMKEWGAAKSSGDRPEAADRPADTDPITSDMPKPAENSEAPADEDPITSDLPKSPETSDAPANEGGMVPAPATPDRAVPALPPDM